MTDEAKALVERLRTKYCCSDWDKGCNCETSADLIETQAREIERLRAVLFSIEDQTDTDVETMWIADIVSAALGESHDQ